MKKKTMFLSLLALVALASCNTGTNSSSEKGSSNTANMTTGVPSTGTSEGGLDTSGSTTDTDDENTAEDTTISANKIDSYSDGDYTFNYIEDYGTYVTDDVKAKIENTWLPETYTEVADSELTITAAGDYYFKGEYTSITLKVAEAGEVHLFFDSATFIGAKKAIEAKSSDLTTTLTITLIEGTENAISSTKNSIDVLSDVVINGKGTLAITSAEKSAIKTEKTAYVSNSTLKLEAQADEDGHGISAESFYGFDATINILDAGKDGIHCEIDDVGLTKYVNSAGFAYLSNVDFTYVGQGDGIQADSFAYIEGGNYDVSNEAHFVAYGSEEAATEGITDSDDFKYKLNNDGTYSKVDSEQRGRSGTYAMLNSVKGIKVGLIDQEETVDSITTETDVESEYYDLTIKDATIVLDTQDDGLHVNGGSIHLDDATITASSLDQPICADGPVTIDDSKIDIKTSYEGIQGSSIHINGSKTDIDIVSSDDGMNASSDYATVDTDFYALKMIVNGGTLNVNAGGDGLDSNGSLIFNGGNSYVQGSPNGGDSPLDSAESNENSRDHGIYVNGGNLVAIGSNGMLESPQTSSSQYSIVYSSCSISSSDVLTVLDGTETLLSLTAGKSASAMILSSPKFEKGKSYTIQSNGKDLTTVTLTSIVTTVGGSSGGNHGGPGGGGGRP